MDGNNYTYQYGSQPQQPQQSQQPQPGNGKKRGHGWSVALALCFALFGGVIGGGTVWGLGRIGQSLPSGSGSSSSTVNILQGKRENVTLDITEIDTGKLLSRAEVYAANVNSTVGILTSITGTNLWGQQTTSAAAGSGFILSAEGHIVTNYHVIKGANKVTVSTYDGKSYDAKIIGYDEDNDIAVLKIEAEGLSPVVLGSSASLNVGDEVVAIGNPLGELTFSLTSGSVSALNREVTFSDGSVMDLIQTDCAINSGNSGGALFNLYGEVIGITNAKYSGNSSSGATIDNIGFAIPIDSVRAILESFVTNGYYEKPYLGVSVSDVDSASQRYGVPAGAAVAQVADGSPAADAGLKVNDVITSLNGTAVSGVSDLKRALAKTNVGDEITLTVWRQSAGSSQTLTLTVKLGAQKATS